MTALPEGRPPETEAEVAPLRAGRPPSDAADDGKTGGAMAGGRPTHAAHRGDGAGINAQTGTTSGSETERDAPGMSTDKKADDTK